MNHPETFKDVYSRVTERIIADLEKGMRTWMKPWNHEHCVGRINKPLRSNGTPYRGINILLLWGEAVMKNFVSPIWMTYRQASELDGQVRKGEHGSLVVYANTITKTTKTDAGDDIDRDIQFMKGLHRVQC
jgi:antirestriction protein ArdC